MNPIIPFRFWMLRISLTIYYSITGKKLLPIVRTNVKKSGDKK
jgi:hypothetical protein